MAKLSDLPPEMIRHIGSFLCPEWPGELMLDHGPEHDWVWEVYGSQNEKWYSLANFSYTTKVYNEALLSERLRSLGVCDWTGGHGVRQLLQLLRLLLHNPAASCNVVRKLFVMMPSHDHACEPFDLSNPSHQRDMQLLEETAQGVGFDIWKETFAPLGDTPSHIIGKILTTKDGFKPHFLQGLLLGLLILHLRNIRDLTIELPAISLMAMTHVLRRVQEQRASGGEKRPILYLHSVAISSSWAFDNQMPGDFEGLFSMRTQASVYFRDCQLHTSLAWSFTITSLALRELRGIDTSTLTDLISNCTSLTRFIYTHDVVDMLDIPSPGTILQALKKHRSSLEILCLSFVYNGDQHHRLPPPYIDSFDDFWRLQGLWINCACFGNDIQSSVLRTIPSSLEKLHLVGDASVIADDLEWWAESLTDESDEEDIDPLAGLCFSSDNESGNGGSQDGKGDSRDQAEDDLDMEEDLLEQEEDNVDEGEVGEVSEDEESEGDEDDDDDDDDEDDDEAEDYEDDVKDYEVDDYDDYEHDENEFEEDEYGQDKNDLEKYGENVCEEELCEEDDYTADEYEYEVEEESERNNKQNTDQQDENRHNENDQKDSNQNDSNQNDSNQNDSNQNDENQEDSQEDEDETEADANGKNKGQGNDHKKRPTRVYIPEELAYDEEINEISIPSKVRTAFEICEWINFVVVDTDPGQWYAPVKDMTKRLWRELS
ncbi:Halomucin [Colletotrichum viniferum]|nr:Halomucin [Colletotrichum viniferum]